MTHIRSAAVLITLGILFGSAFLFMKVVVDEMEPASLVAWRLALGATAVLGVIVLKRQSLGWTPGLVAKTALLAALGLVIPYALVAWAETRIDSGIAAALISTMPIFTAVYASFLFTDERLTLGRIAGLLAGFAGVVALNGGSLDIAGSNFTGQLAVVGAASSYAAGAAYSRKLLKHEQPLSLAGLELTTGALIALPLAFIFDGVPGTALTVQAWGALIALGLGSTGAAIVGYLWLVDQAGSVRASLVAYVVPVVGLFLGWAVLREHVGAEAVIGTALIALGVAGAMSGRVPVPRRELGPAPLPQPALHSPAWPSAREAFAGSGGK